MCGIFGVIAKEEKYKRKELVELLEDVAKLSQVRGKDSSGIAGIKSNLVENRDSILSGCFLLFNL